MIHEFVPEHSTNIARLVYDDVAQVLKATFKNKTTGADAGSWEYFGVLRAQFDAVCHPGDEFNQSVGRAFHHIIRAVKSGRPV